jgi:hypothetical protein
MSRVLKLAGFLSFCLLFNTFGDTVYNHPVAASFSGSQSIVDDISFVPLQCDNIEITQNSPGKHRPVKGDRSKRMILENPFCLVIVFFVHQTIHFIWNNFFPLHTRAP